jgi:hypothetical protein
MPVIFGEGAQINLAVGTILIAAELPVTAILAE